MNKLALLSSIKIPEFIREEYPALVTFVEAYYSYLETLDSIDNAADLDKAAQQYVKLAKETIAKGFADPEFLSLRHFIYANKDFFSRKGTEEAFVFFFKAYFGEIITLGKPNYLVASGGDAVGDYFFYMTKLEGTLSLYDIIEIQRPYSSNIQVDTIKVVSLDENTYAVYFIPPLGFTSRVGDICLVKNSQGTVTFKGSIRSTPARIQVVTPGKFWQVGQVIKIPSTVGDFPTIARVTSVNNTNGMLKVEVLQWGYPTRSEQYAISSLVGVATNDTDSIAYEQITLAEDDRYFEEKLDIYDNSGEITDIMVASLVSTGGTDDYFEDAAPDDYQDEDYVGNLQTFNPTYAYIPGNNLERYKESIATIKLIGSNISKDRTIYTSENSLLSNQNTRIHDNLNYQAYAYFIQTETDINKYRSSLELIHPAGTKFSAVLIKKMDIVNTNVALIKYEGFPTVMGVNSLVSPGNVNINFNMGVTGSESTVELGNI